MADARDAGIPREEVARRLEELRALYKLGIALMNARFVDAPSEVREGPPDWEPPRSQPPRES